MAVRIRLARAGTNNRPFYYLVAADSNSPRDGKYLARLGTFDPKFKEVKEQCNIDHEALNAWIAKGALVSETIANLLKQSSK